MVRVFLSIALVLIVAAASAAEPEQQLAKELSGLGFLVGSWASKDGKVADTGTSSRGTSLITVEAGGAVLLRRDHTDVADAKGTTVGSFEQIMMIYPDGGTLRADYSDGTRVIHYTSVAVTPSKSVSFTSDGKTGGPVFKLNYEAKADGTIAVSFSIKSTGQANFAPVASGTLEAAPHGG